MLSIDLRKLQNKAYLLKSRNYEKDLAKDIGGEFHNEQMYDILEGKTRYEIKKQMYGQVLEAGTCAK